MRNNVTTAITVSLMLLDLTANGQNADEPMDSRIKRLLQAEEFKEERIELISIGSAALPALVQLFDSSSDATELGRIIRVATAINGNHKPFLLKMQVLAKGVIGYNQVAQMVAIQSLGVIGSSDQAPLLEELILDRNQSLTAHFNAVRALGKIGNERSLAALAKALANAEKDTHLRSEIETTVKAIRVRHGVRPPKQE